MGDLKLLRDLRARVSEGHEPHDFSLARRQRFGFCSARRPDRPSVFVAGLLGANCCVSTGTHVGLAAADGDTVLTVAVAPDGRDDLAS